MRIEWSVNRILAEHVIRKCWDKVSEDAVSINEYVFPEIDNDCVRVANCYHNEKFYGCFFLYKKSDKIAEIHTCLIGHGKAKQFGDLIVQKVWNDTDFDIIETLIPEDNPAARKLAEKCGFSFKEWTNPIFRKGIEIPTQIWGCQKCQLH